MMMTMTIIVMKTKEVNAIGLRTMMSAESLELANHRTIANPAATARPDGKICFSFFLFLFFRFFFFFHFQLGPLIGCLFFLCVSHHVLRILTNLHV